MDEVTRKAMYADVKMHMREAQVALTKVCALLSEGEAQDVQLGLVVADLPLSFCRGAVAGIEEGEKRGLI